MSLLSTLSLSDAPIQSSIDTLQCSADGQFAIVTRSVVYIVTPNFDSKTESKPGSSEANASLGAFAWFKTAVHDAEKARGWSGHNEDWCTVSLGSLEPAWQAAVWSPSGLTKLGGCLLVTLTNNAEVFIWAPKKNPFTGEWSKIQNITESQLSAYEQGGLMAADDVLRCQTSAIAWSRSLWEDDIDSPLGASSSLLVLGNRFGDLNLFYWDSVMYEACQCLNFHVDNAWVTNLAWSQWKLVKDANSSSIAQAYLACGLSDGSVWILIIQHNPNSEEPYSVSKLPRITEADGRSITAMTFDYTHRDYQLLLAIAKPGFVHLYSQSGLPDSRTPENVSLQTVLLSAVHTSLASTSIATCTGLYYVPSEDRMIIVLAEGSLNVVANASGTAYLEGDNDGPDRRIAPHDSKVMRRLSETAEEGTLSQAEYARIYGFRPIGSGRHVVWTQMVLQPYDLSFRVQANFRTRVCIAKLWGQEENTNNRITYLAIEAQRATRSITYWSPTAQLCELIFEILDPNTVVSVAPRLLPLLAPGWEPTVSSGIRVIDPAETATPPWLIRRTRLKFSLTLFILSRSGLPNDLVALVREAHNELLELLMALHVYKEFSRILSRKDKSGLDAVAILRFVHAAQHCYTHDAVAHRFLELKTKAQEYAQNAMLQQQPLDGNSRRQLLELFSSVDIGEKCAACDSVVLFQNMAYGRCQAGHIWGM